MAVSTAEPRLGFSATFDDLYRREGLAKLDKVFLSRLGEAGYLPCATTWLLGRASPPPDYRDEAELVLALAPHVNDFIGELFGIGREMAALAARQNELAPLYACKRLFVQRRAKAVKPAEAETLSGDALEAGIDRFVRRPLGASSPSPAR